MKITKIRMSSKDYIQPQR